MGILYLSFHSMLQDIIPPEETQTTAAPPTVSTTPPVLAVPSAHTAPPPEHDPDVAFLDEFNDSFTEVKNDLRAVLFVNIHEIFIIATEFSNFALSNLYFTFMAQFAE